MTLKDILIYAGILKQQKPPADVAAEANRFLHDPAFVHYMDEARMNIITEMHSLSVNDIEKFQELKRCQMALDGLQDFMESAILSAKMREARETASNKGR